MKWFKVICFNRWFFNIFIKIIINDTNCAIKVATPIPVIPNGGINKNPKIKIGFKIIFRQKENMRTFLYVTVSPSACKKEFKATTNINNTVPKKITLIYSNPLLNSL